MAYLSLRIVIVFNKKIGQVMKSILLKLVIILTNIHSKFKQ